MRRETLAGLDLIWSGGTDGNGGGDGPLVLLMHGFGAPGEDLVPLGGMLAVPPSVRFVFPAAPHAIEGGWGDGRAWWMIDLSRLDRNGVGDLSGEVPVGLAEARAQVLALIAALDERAGKSAPLVIGGFSQGAMLACDVAGQLERPLAGLVQLSGTLLAARLWGPRLAARAGLPVFQSHGTADPILPFAMAERLRDFLTEAGLSVEWVTFRGGHEIPRPVLAALSRFLVRVTDQSAVR
jgi:phospholipase/carboxylesterase